MPIPASGAAQPSAPRVLHRADAGPGAVIAIAELHARRKAGRRIRRPARAAGADTVVPNAFERLAVGARTGPGIPSDADLAMLPFSLGGVMSLIPRFDAVACRTARAN